MVFKKDLRDRVRRGEITMSVRIWMSARVKAGGRYPMEEGQIEVESVEPIALSDITDELARASGFSDAGELMRVARHGRGENVYLVRFRYIDPFAEAARINGRTTSENPPLKRRARNPRG